MGTAGAGRGRGLRLPEEGRAEGVGSKKARVLSVEGAALGIAIVESQNPSIPVQEGTWDAGARRAVASLPRPGSHV